jgi:D-glycero-alpha-D-manno-heptose 1-phosphate guanylyltransferase
VREHRSIRLVITEAIVLAGGFGTRLRAVVKDVPKPMAPVRGRPFLEYLLDYLANQGLRKVVLSVGYLSETIEAAFGRAYKTLSLDYVHEHHPLGTGGGMRFALASFSRRLFDLPLRCWNRILHRV